MLGSNLTMYPFYLLFIIVLLKVNLSASATISEIKIEAKNPLILTPFIESGNVDQARKLAQVNHEDFKGVESYSGFFTVNKTCGSNLFFWYFPAEKAPESAPVVLYLNGGPGGSSLVCMLAENGPIILAKNDEIVRRDSYSWTDHFHLIYIDNPVNVGYSYTENKECLAKDEKRIGNELHSALVQFVELFPNLQKNDFYVAGVSYAGHYVPATAYTIHKKNPTANAKINLKGIFLQDGFIDMFYQLRLSPYLYELGFIDEDGRQQFENVENKIHKALEEKDWNLAMQLSVSMMYDSRGYSLLTNLTGLRGYHNYIEGDVVSPFGDFSKFFNRKDIQKALHTEGVAFAYSANDAMFSLWEDFPQGVTSEFIELLNNGYKVMLYNGQLDVTVAYPLTRDLINEIEFNGKSEFQAAQRYIWQVDDDVAGYVRQGGPLTFALVRNAGHVADFDQPKWVKELVLGFIHPECVKFEDNRRKFVENCLK